MEQRVSLITLAVEDLAGVRRFWLDGMGWSPFVESEGEVLMLEVADRVLLSLWDADHFREEVGPIVQGEGHPPLTLAHNVRTAAEVDAVLDQARAVGARSVTGGQHREWGGYSGYFVDPAGFVWEVAWAPGEVGERVLGLAG